MRKNIFFLSVLALFVFNNVLAKPEYACFRCTKWPSRSYSQLDIARDITTCDIRRVYDLQNENYQCIKQEEK